MDRLLYSVIDLENRPCLLHTNLLTNSKNGASLPMSLSFSQLNLCKYAPVISESLTSSFVTYRFALWPQFIQPLSSVFARICKLLLPIHLNTRGWCVIMLYTNLLLFLDQHLPIVQRCQLT